MPAAPALAATAEQCGPATQSASNLNQLFNLAAQRFWHVEPQFNYSDNFIESLPILPPISAKRPQYRLAAATAEAFLRVQARSGADNWQTPTMLYLAAAAESSLGNDSEALALIERLLTQFPKYRRPRMEGFPALDRPTSGELNRLALFHTLRLIAPQLSQALQTAAAPTNATGKPSPYLAELLKTQTPLQLLAGFAQRGSIAVHTEAQLSIHTDPNAVDMEHGYPTPCQLRAAASPGVGEMVTQLHEALLPLALKTNGAKAVRDYLRTLTVGAQPVDHPFSGYAWIKLQSIDGDILAGYQRSAEAAISGRRWAEARSWLQKIVAEYAGLYAANKATERLTFVTLSQYQDDAHTALAQFRFADARALYKRIMAEFPDTVAASQAAALLKQSVPIAVKYYRDEGDKSFQPQKQYGVAQAKAVEFYGKMYKEDPDGPQADYALVQWSRALGTTGDFKGAIAHLRQLLQERPAGKEASQAKFLIGFYQGTQKQYPEAIATLGALVATQPQCSQAPEALWYSAFYAAEEKQPAQAVVFLKQLQTAYPGSKRAPHAQNYIDSLTQASRPQ